MTTAKIATIVVVLGLPRSASVATLIERVSTIANTMAENKTTFPSPVPSTATVLGDVAALSAAQTAFKGKTGSRADRDAKIKVVVFDAGQLHGYVQSIVNANPENAESIVAQAAMTLRKKGAKSKPSLAVKQTVSGTVSLAAKATKGARMNEWQYSTDGGKTWNDVPPTTQAKTVITGLTPGVSVSYRQRAVTKDGRGDWSPTLSAVVT